MSSYATIRTSTIAEFTSAPEMRAKLLARMESPIFRVNLQDDELEDAEHRLWLRYEKRKAELAQPKPDRCGYCGGHEREARNRSRCNSCGGPRA